MAKTILMLEHDEDDRYLTEAIFEDNDFQAKLEFVTNSHDLMQYLRDAEKGIKGLPSLILLNYHAFPLNAVEVLGELKSHSVFRTIPVVILGGTLRSEVIRECYAAGASTVIKKPSINADEKIRSFVRYWFDTAELV